MKNLLSILVLLSLLSCERFIDLDLPADQLTTETVFNDPVLAQAAVAGLYRSMDQNGFLSGGFAGGGLYLGTYTDELTSYQFPNSDLYDLYNLTVTPRSGAASALWDASYNQIYQANIIISGLETSSGITDILKRQFRGEALFVRALLHYYLLQTYGEIPYVTSTSYNDNRTLKKISPSEVYAKIDDDLNSALELLPENTPAGKRFRPSKAAVQLVKSRTALSQGKWQDVLTATDALVSSNQYQLNPVIANAYLKNNPSTIWQFSPPSATAATQEANIYTLYFAPPFVVALSPDLIRSFDQRDLRLKNWTDSVVDFMGNRYYFSAKYKQTMVFSSQDEFSVILRSEEAVLNRAEAFAQLGMLQASVDEINKIITRAGLDPIPLMAQSSLIKRIMLERRHELFTEYGHRFIDLKRTKTIDETMSVVKPQWKSHFQVLPLPEKELLLNPNLYPQNVGY